jgi:hypothetical protein
MRRGSILAATGAAIWLVAGCGGGDDELSKAEFVKRADGICLAAYKQATKNGKEISKGDVASRMTDLMNREAEEIADLNGPSDDADEIDAIVDSTRAVAEAVESNKKDLSQAGALIGKARKAADAYGLEACPLGIAS